MASSTKKSAEDDLRQNEAEKYREAVANAYTFVEAQKSVQSFTALTPEDLMDRFIERVSGKDTQARPNVINRIARIKNNVISAVEKIKALPADAFRKHDEKKNVNTDPNPSEDSLYADSVTKI